jgi:hypothetical protein
MFIFHLYLSWLTSQDLGSTAVIVIVGFIESIVAIKIYAQKVLIRDAVFIFILPFCSLRRKVTKSRRIASLLLWVQPILSVRPLIHYV